MTCTRGGGEENALCFAIQGKHIEAVQLLLTSGLKAYHDASHGGSPLHTAAYHRHAPILLLLLEHGVGGVSSLDSWGRTALHNVCRRPGTTDIVDSLTALLDHGAAIDQLSRDGRSALHYAVENNHTSGALFLGAPAGDVASAGGTTDAATAGGTTDAIAGVRSAAAGPAEAEMYLTVTLKSVILNPKKICSDDCSKNLLGLNSSIFQHRYCVCI